MAKQKKTTDIGKYRRKFNLNIGTFLFGVIFVYLIVTIILYFTSSRVTMYEIRQGSIVKDTAYTGLAVRQETVVHADAEGYLNYYVPDGNKVGSGARVYALSTKKITTNDDTQGTAVESLSEENRTSMNNRIIRFADSNTSSSYSQVYDLHYHISSIMDDASTESVSTQLDTLAADGTTLSTYTAPTDGIVEFNLDNMDGLTLDQISMDSFNQSKYSGYSTRNLEQIKSSDAVYKLITSENWQIVIPLDDNETKSLADTTNVEVRMGSDNATLWADFSILKKEGDSFGVLSFDNSLIRYASERFLNLELILEDQTGLKIPKSAVCTQELYIVPSFYLTQGGNNKGDGVLVKSGDSSEFKNINVYYSDAATGNMYISTSTFKKGEVLIKPDSTDTYTINETQPLKGIYNINKGYAQFQYIDILSENEEYYIIASGSEYGPSNYDHIALDASKTKENQIVQ